jgi:hypothetical protein
MDVYMTAYTPGSVGSVTGGKAGACDLSDRCGGEVWVDCASMQAERAKTAPAKRIEKRRIYGRL